MTRSISSWQCRGGSGTSSLATVMRTSVPQIEQQAMEIDEELFGLSENRELLDPQVKKALSMCVDRERIIEVVFNGYASLVESLVGLGLSTSKVRTYAPPRPKRITGWPL